MSDFSFKGTTECDHCGEYLQDSQAECDCADERVMHMFRGIGSTEPDTIAVEATMDYKWNRLKAECGDEWMCYEYLGPKDSVRKMVGTASWDTLDDIPRQQHPADVPSQKL